MRGLPNGLVVLALIALPFPAFAQVWPQSGVDMPAPELIDNTGEASLEDRAEAVSELIEHPVDLNTANRTEITAVPGFSAFTAARLVSFRQANGPFASLVDIAQVPGIDADVLKQVEPYVQLSSPSRASERPRVLVSQTLQRRLETAKGYLRTAGAPAYSGSPVSAKTRVRLSYRGFRGNIRMEKDAGELIVWKLSERRLGFDHVTANLSYTSDSIIEHIVVGDYRLASDTGLLHGNPGIHSPDRPVPHRPGGIRSRSAPGEGRRLRGAAMTLRLLRHLRVTTAVSSRRRDALPSADLADSMTVVLSSEDGLRRTSTELGNRNRLRERVYAFAVSARFGAFSIGVAGYQLMFNRTVAPSSRPDEKWGFRGDRQRVYGAHAAFEGSGRFCKLETTFADGPAAAIIYCRWKPDRRLAAWFLARTYSGRRVGLLGSTYARFGGPPRNESGVLLGFSRKLRPRTSLSVHVDMWWTPWLRYQQHAPSSGAEAALTFDMTGSMAAAMLRVVAITRSAADVAAESGAGLVETSSRTTEYRLTARTRLTTSRHVHLEARISATKKRGTGFYADAISGALSIRANVRLSSALELTAQATTYNAHDGARLYVVQPALASGFGVRSASGRGEQWVLLLSCRVTQDVLIQTRYAHTTRFDVTSTGSGLDETPGPTIREAGIQIRIRT